MLRPESPPFGGHRLQTAAALVNQVPESAPPDQRAPSQERPAGYRSGAAQGPQVPPGRKPPRALGGAPRPRPDLDHPVPQPMALPFLIHEYHCSSPTPVTAETG